ncbi:hypothetical protein Avbf_16610 [Armadillidium vulgare]|nr:hypothetical protein Avbf_16610 [Armadillidium vulgare]
MNILNYNKNKIKKHINQLRSFQNTSSACVFKKFVEKYQEEHSVQKLSMEYIKTCSGQAKGFTYRQTKNICLQHQYHIV